MLCKPGQWCKITKKPKKVPRIEVIKEEISETDPFVDQSNYKIIEKFKYTLEIKTETTTEPELIMGIETPLDTMSITLQRTTYQMLQNQSEKWKL